MRTGAPHTAPGARTRRAGMTLIELLMVMGLLALLMGIGVGMLASLDPGRRTAVSTVGSALRAARNNAVARSAPARVRIDAETGTLRSEGLRVVGTWRFEDELLSGAFELHGDTGGGDVPLTEDGFLGRGLDFGAAAAGSTMGVDVRRDPAFDPAEGFALDLAVRLNTDRPAPLVDVGQSLGLEVGPEGRLVGWLLKEAASATGARVKGARVRIETPPGAVRPGHWAQVRFDYDRRVARILVDGQELVRRPAEARVWRLEGPLLVGAPKADLDAVLDDLVVAVVGDSAEVVLPEGVRFAPDVPREVRYAAGGALDPALHRVPVEIELRFDDGEPARLSVGLYGTVDG